MVPEEVIRPDAEASIEAFLSKSKGGGRMRILDTGEEALALQPVAGWGVPDTAEPPEWLFSGGFEAGDAFPEAPGFYPVSPLAFGDEDDDDDVDDDEDNFDDMEDDFEDDFEDEDDDFEDEDDDFEDEDEDDDYDYDEDGDYDDDFEE